MSNMLREAISETVLKCAVIENHNREMDAIPPNDVLEKMYSFSENHILRMKRLFAKEKRKKMFLNAIIVSKKIAAVVMVIFSMFFVSLLTNSNVRAAVGQTIVEWYDNYTSFRYRETEIPDESVTWFPRYLPPGFNDVEDTSLGEINSLEFRNPNGEHIYFEYTIAEGFSIGVDNEHSNFEMKNINGVDYYIFKAISDEYRSKIIWQEAGYRFYIASLIDASELLLIAISTSPE